MEGDGIWKCRFVKRWPSGAAFKFAGSIKQVTAAARTMVLARLKPTAHFGRKSSFRSMEAGNPKNFRIELGFPLIGRFFNPTVWRWVLGKAIMENGVPVHRKDMK